MASSRRTTSKKPAAKRAAAKRAAAKRAAAKRAGGKTPAAKKTAKAPKQWAALAPRRGDERRYWLVKSEPGVFSFDDLLASAQRTTSWEGVRNYQARNFMRDGMRRGDGVLFYHSNAEPPAIVGVAEVAREAYPDPSQFDRASEYFDSKSRPHEPTWVLVDLRGVAPLRSPLSLAALRDVPALADMELLRRGSRLSVQPVTRAEWEAILRLGGVDA